MLLWLSNAALATSSSRAAAAPCWHHPALRSSQAGLWPCCSQQCSLARARRRFCPSPHAERLRKGLLAQLTLPSERLRCSQPRAPSWLSHTAFFSSDSPRANSSADLTRGLDSKGGQVAQTKAWARLLSLALELVTKDRNKRTGSLVPAPCLLQSMLKEMLQ